MQGTEGATSRTIKREMRVSTRQAAEATTLPESTLWNMYIELRRREDPDANQLLVQGLKSILERRSYSASRIPFVDPDPREHKLVDDAYLGELFKAYKRCICSHRTQPAGQLLRDIETQLSGH
jgi:hypothetical protein